MTLAWYNKSQEHYDFLTSTLLQHLGHILWRAGILTVDEKSEPPAVDTSQHRARQVEHWNYRTQAQI